MDINLTEKFQEKVAYIKEHLDKPIYLTGLMGAGKSKLGKNLAALFNVTFADADDLIVEHAGKSIPDIFEGNGEPYFRQVEAGVISSQAQGELSVLALGGGAFMTESTRQLIKEGGVSVFLKADLDTLSDRVGDGVGRPLLTLDENKTPRDKLSELIDVRYPVYGQADVVVEVSNSSAMKKEESIQQNVERVIEALYNHLQP